MTETYAIMVITLVGFVCFLWGASWVKGGDAPVSRAPWFLFRRLLDLFVILIVLALNETMQSPQTSNPVVAFTVLGSLIAASYGYLLGLGGARRSISIRGDTVMALLAVAPIFNLYLLFAAPKSSDKHDLNWLYIVGGLIALLLTYSLSSDIVWPFSTAMQSDSLPP